MVESLQVASLLVLGLLFGSFLNVVIHRLPLAESETSTWWVGYRSLVSPSRSQCPNCGHAIAWYENIPVVSWLALRGKCSACKTPISPRYVLVELLTGVLFVACSVRFGWTYALLPSCVLMALVVPLVFIDASHWILPFELTLPGIALGLGLAIPLGLDAFIASVIGASAAFLAFRVMEFVGWLLFRKEALGAGDKFLLAMLGAFLGWRPLFGVLFLSSLQGAVFGLISLGLRGRASSDAPLPVEGEADAASAEEPVEPGFTPEWKEPGLTVLQRLLAVPYVVFLQPIPDDPPAEETAEGEPVAPEWTPGTTSMPFGPWIGLAGIEVLLLTPWLRTLFEGSPFSLTVRLLFGEG